MIAARRAARVCRSRGAVSVHAAESQTDRHLVVEFSGVVFSTVGVGVTVSCRGVRHYGVVAVVVVVVVIVVFATAVAIVAVVVVVIVRPVLTPRSLSLSSTLSVLKVVTLRLSYTGGSFVLVVWWYRGCESPSCGLCSSRGPAIQLLAPQKALVVPFVGQRESERERERERERDRQREIERAREGETRREEEYWSVGVVNTRGARGTR